MHHRAEAADDLCRRLVKIALKPALEMASII
jgi:hypothetical protein